MSARPELEYEHVPGAGVAVRAVGRPAGSPEVALFSVSDVLTADEAEEAAERFTGYYHALPGGMNHAAEARAPEVTIPEATWRDRTGDGSVLVAAVWICGCAMHVEAHAVEVRHGAFECSGHLQTITIRGRDYVLFAVAHG